MSVQERLTFMRKGMGVRRYHQRHTIAIDTVGKHSAGVALFLILMYGDEALPRSPLLAAALAHDLPEWVVGDIPSPAKNAMSSMARVQLQAAEDQLLYDHGLEYDLSEQEWKELKEADCFDGLMFCIEERRRGNREVEDVANKYLEYISQLDTGARHEKVIKNILYKWWDEANEQR